MTLPVASCQLPAEANEKSRRRRHSLIAASSAAARRKSVFSGNWQLATGNALILLLPLILFGCRSMGGGGGTVAGDVYEIRLALQNLQQHQQASHDEITADLRGVRATQEQQMESLSARITDLEQAMTALSSEVTGTPYVPVTPTVQLSLPPDPESPQPIQLEMGQPPYVPPTSEPVYDIERQGTHTYYPPEPPQPQFRKP